MLALYGPEGGAAVPLLPKRALVLVVLAPVVRGGAAGVRALLKQAGGIEITGSLAKVTERSLGRQVGLEIAPFPRCPGR